MQTLFTTEVYVQSLHESQNTDDDEDIETKPGMFTLNVGIKQGI